jgi:hypothetical protein
MRGARWGAPRTERKGRRQRTPRAYTARCEDVSIDSQESMGIHFEKDVFNRLLAVVTVMCAPMHSEGLFWSLHVRVESSAARSKI